MIVRRWRTPSTSTRCPRTPSSSCWGQARPGLLLDRISSHKVGYLRILDFFSVNVKYAILMYENPPDFSSPPFLLIKHKTCIKRGDKKLDNYFPFFLCTMYIVQNVHTIYNARVYCFASCCTVYPSVVDKSSLIAFSYPLATLIEMQRFYNFLHFRLRISVR